MKINKISMLVLMAYGFGISVAQAKTGITSYCAPARFHAQADGKTLNTSALQQTIDQCSAHGGGVVTLHAGLWLSGPLQLKNGVTLELDAGAVLKASNEAHDFHQAFIGAPAQAGEAFILANGVKDVGIVGAGTIDGSGDTLWWPEAKTVREHTRVGDWDYFRQRYPGIPLANGVPRPWLIEFNQVTNGNIGAILATNSPMWNVVLRNSQQIKMDGTRIRNPEDAPNTDGVDIVGSDHVQMSHLDISTGDDDIAIKSGLPGMHDLNRASQDITLTDSVIQKGHGVSVGSETSHGIGAVVFRNLRFYGTENGIRVKSARDRGNQIGPVTADHLRMFDVRTPILLTDSYGGQSGHQGKLPAIEVKPVTVNTPYIHDVEIKDLQAFNAVTAGVLSGLPEAPLRGIHLENILIQSQTGLQTAYVQGTLRQVKLLVQHGAAISQGPSSSLQLE